MENKKLSKTQELIVLAYNKGYRIINNECITPKGKTLKGTIKTHPVPYKQFSMHTDTGARSVTFHAMLAYQLFGEKYFEKGIVARHLNGDSLDNSEANIILVTQKDNTFDRSSEERSDAIRKGGATKRFIYSDDIMNDIKKDYVNGLGAKWLYEKYNTSLSTMYTLIKNFKRYGLLQAPKIND